MLVLIESDQKSIMGSSCVCEGKDHKSNMVSAQYVQCLELTSAVWLKIGHIQITLSGTFLQPWYRLRRSLVSDSSFGSTQRSELIGCFFGDGSSLKRVAVSKKGYSLVSLCGCGAEQSEGGFNAQQGRFMTSFSESTQRCSSLRTQTCQFCFFRGLFLWAGKGSCGHPSSFSLSMCVRVTRSAVNQEMKRYQSLQLAARGQFSKIPRI